MGTSSGAPRIAALALGTLGTLTLFSAVGCSKVAELQAQKAFKDANAAYQQQDYKKAAGLYDEAVQDNPELGTAYFFLGNSYDNLWKAPTRSCCQQKPPVGAIPGKRSP